MSKFRALVESLLKNEYKKPYNFYGRNNKFLKTFKEEIDKIFNQSRFDYNKNEYNRYLNKVKNGGLEELLNVPKKFKDYAMCQAAIENTLLYRNVDYNTDYIESLLQAIPKELLDFENSGLYFEIVKQYAPALRFVPDKFKDYAMCLEATKNNPETLKFVPENIIDYNMCLSSVKEHAYALKYIPDAFKDYTICLEAVNQNGYNIEYVPEKFKNYEMYLQAVRNGPSLNKTFLEQVPEKFRDYRMWLAMIIQDGHLIKDVPPKFRDKKMILNAFRTNGSAIYYDKDYQYFDIDSDGNIDFNSKNDFMNKFLDFKLPQN